MCLESGERSRRCRAPLPMLCLGDSSASSSDSECAMPIMPARNSLPEIFTFDVEAVQAAPAKLSRRGTLRPRSKRHRRVLYPAKVRKYLPAPETDRPLRWLYILCLLVFVQICCEEAMPDDQPLPTVPTMVTLDDLQLFALPLHVEPTVPFTNHSQGAQINDTTLSWLMYQR
ncbi:PREDICTED: radiation-inducible immediate-early gene IEX-1 [Nanorana parkeri]|uniref:radiation-inducible immediate-early gene IEX-1 n=1 Tax=Nanorana parkeri TaxID=125878 RepID=UPI000854D99F|nr:PREDICTED: radiation-inducible immediate-early gene IEX-1 [Nanorana parkeri]